METITLESLKEDSTFKSDLIIDDTFIVLAHSANVTKELIAALREWEFTSISTADPLVNEFAPKPSVNQNTNEQTEEVYEHESSDNTESDSSEEDINADDITKKSDTVRIGESVKKAIENSKNAPQNNSNTARMEMVRQVYEEYMNYIEQVFRHYATHKQINQEEISETVKELCIFIKENKRFILRVDASQEYKDKNFLVRHSMRTTVLAIVIGLQLRMPLSKMIELGVSCILHEIGMLRLPPSVYMTDRKLTLGEKAQILKHPLYGYTIVKDLDFPLPIQLGILEHHEKENGTGYPRKLPSEKISTIAKIISVACSYEAITAPRSYKNQRTEFEAMIEVLKNPERQYDDTVIKALLYSVSLYPIGAYVYLTNRKIAIVIDTNPDNPKFPVVQSISEKEPDGSPKIIQTSPDGITIARILTKSEQDDIIKLMEERYKAIEEAQKIAEQNLQEQKEKEEHASQEPTENNTENTPSENTDSSQAATPSADMNQMEEVDISLFT